MYVWEILIFFSFMIKKSFNVLNMRFKTVFFIITKLLFLIALIFLKKEKAYCILNVPLDLNK